MQTESGRWYDYDEELRNYIDGLKDMSQDERDVYIKEMLKLIKKDCSNLLEMDVLEYSLDLKRRRWYDDDPYLWMLINSLKFADRSFLEKIKKFFRGRKK